MKQALGLVEIRGLSTAVVVADTMVKAANIRILEIENTKGLGYMTIKISGDVGAVNAAVSAGKQTAMENQKLVSWKVIARPSDSVEHTFGAPEPSDPVPSDKLSDEEEWQENTFKTLEEQELPKEEAAKMEPNHRVEADLELPGENEPEPELKDKEIQESELETEVEGISESQERVKTDPEFHLGSEFELESESHSDPEFSLNSESHSELEQPEEPKESFESPVKQKAKSRKPRSSKGKDLP